jgi:hypothetical protein
MRNLKKLFEHITLPPMVRMSQVLPDNAIGDVAGETLHALVQSGLSAKVRPGMRVAVAVGSRGVANLPILVRSVVGWLREVGAEPFIIPAMGSHGNATAAGQTSLLADLGVTEATAGCGIRSCMDVVPIGRLSNGLGVYIDRIAHEEAGGIFVINRVKPHTSFRGKWESGLVKMLTIGLGKQVGADSCHTYGFHTMAENLPAMAAITLAEVNILGGLAVVENANDKTCLIEAVPADDFMRKDAELLAHARTCMPSLPFDQLDVLIIDEIGKNISGCGADPNIIGRYTVSHMSGGPSINRIVALDITESSHGNAIGMGLADFIPERFKDKIDFEAVYMNALTATSTRGACMPMALPTDSDAIRAAIKTSSVTDISKLRMARIRNTLEISELYVTPCMVDELLRRGCVAIEEIKTISFSADGQLV